VPLLRACLATIAALAGLILATPILFTGLPFWAITFLTRIFSRLLESQTIPWQEIIQFYPIIGWKPKPNLNSHALADDVFHFTTDNNGWRGKSSLQESDVVVFGDSFAFGYGVNDSSFFADINPTLRIKAIKTNRYNMVQSLL
jgi:hypothetical protein